MPDPPIPTAPAMATPSYGAPPAGFPPPAMSSQEQLVLWARRGLVLLALVVLGAGLLMLFSAVNDVIVTWLDAKWVPVWRAIFAVAVTGLAVGVLMRVTRTRLF